jgi:hypothetical protein
MDQTELLTQFDSVIIHNILQPLASEFIFKVLSLPSERIDLGSIEHDCDGVLAMREKGLSYKAETSPNLHNRQYIPDAERERSLLVISLSS